MTATLRSLSAGPENQPWEQHTSHFESHGPAQLHDAAVAALIARAEPATLIVNGRCMQVQLWRFIVKLVVPSERLDLASTVTVTVLSA